MKITAITIVSLLYIGYNCDAQTFEPNRYEPIKPNVQDPLNVKEYVKWANEQERIDKLEARSKTEANINQIKSLYNSIAKPISIPNGWYNVFSTNSYDFGDYRNVYVENNKITGYLIGDNKDNSANYRNVVFSSNLENGKAIIQIDFQNQKDMLEIYFIEYLMK